MRINKIFEKVVLDFARSLIVFTLNFFLKDFSSGQGHSAWAGMEKLHSDCKFANGNGVGWTDGET